MRLLIIKINECECPKSGYYILFFVCENMTLKNDFNIFKLNLTKFKSPSDSNSGSVVHYTNALDHWATLIYDKCFE